jgi:tRNA U34 5-methylaminomethyl-2-thiouridine-forming methyltransferase MnmC
VSIEIITTADGSHTLRDQALGETYHSVHGAIQESVHVFIEKGLMFFTGKGKPEITILEMGFGTGLNALLTLQKARVHKQKVIYTTVEPYPLPENIWSVLNYTEGGSDAEEFKLLHSSPWQIGIPLDPCFELLKIRTTLQEYVPECESFDLIYYDAFAPSKQPELWELQMLKKVVAALKPGGVFVTYCAQGQLKRNLKALMLDVETMPGPPGKKEMVRGRKA